MKNKMDSCTKEQLLKLLSWVNKNCQSINDRASMLEIGINPDGIPELYKAVEKIKTSQGE